MDRTTEEKFTVFEWTIENFTCWEKGRQNLQQRILQSEPRPDMVRFELFRWPVTGDREPKLWANISNIPGKVKGDFSLICSDGIPIWTKQVDKDDDAYEHEFIGALPLNFYDLATFIRAKKAGDRLTLRFRYEDEEGGALHSMHSMFEGKTIYMKISLLSILTGEPSETVKSRVITAEYPLDDGGTEQVQVKIIERHSSKIDLILIPLSSKKSIIFRTSMSVLHSDGTVARTEENEEEIKQGDVWPFCSSLSRNEVVQGGLSILLHLTVFPSNELKHVYTLSAPFVGEVVARYSAAPSKKLAELAPAAFANDFLRLQQNGDFSDFQLRCEGVSFPVHKSILSARSPVFKTMLLSDMKEAASGSADIEDLDAPTLARLLTFLYSGTLNNRDLRSDAESLKLYYAADKYQVPSLKTACADVLSAEVSTESVCDVLRLADMHRDDRLATVARSFIQDNDEEVTWSEEWRNLMETDSSLVSETLEAVSWQLP